nr:NAD(P)/FAD-dependent oxidoreductase [Micrococcus lylae]
MSHQQPMRPVSGFPLPEGVEPGRVAVVGSGPNGLTAAALLARAGWEVDVYEAADRLGGACASAPVLGEGTVVDLGAAGHPLGVVSPAFAELDLTAHGLQWLHPEVPMAHPLPGQDAVLLHREPEATASGLHDDGRAWLAWHRPVLDAPAAAAADVLGPLVRRWPHPLTMARLGLRSPWPAAAAARAAFRGDRARALFLGSAAHTILPPTRPLTAAMGTLFGGLGMTTGWPVARGGSQSVVDALLSVLAAHGGRLHTGRRITHLAEVADVDAAILDLMPAAVAALGGTGMEARPLRRLRRWRHGPASAKVDFLLDGPIPWTDPRVGGAGTVHLGGTPEQLTAAEAAVAAGRMPERPFVMLCQQQGADPSRATGPAAGSTVVWAYAHVPHGWEAAVRPVVEAVIEEHAPGFRDRILRAVETGPSALQAWNPNLVGGDIAGGALDGTQLLARPRLLSPHRLRAAVRGSGVPGLYLASSAAAPGAGVHGMSGAWAVRTLLRDAA